MKTNPQIVIIGSALSGNKGAAAMLESAVQTLSERYADPKFTLLSMYPAEDRLQNPYKNLDIVDASPLMLGVGINSWALVHRVLPFARNVIHENSPAVRALKGADILLDQGGITFVDGREKFLLYNVASILPAINLGVPVVKCAQALGSFHNPINKWAAKTYLPKMAAIVSRGAVTHEYLAGLNLRNVTEGADYAFLLDVTEDDKKSAEAKFDVKFFAKGKVVGVSPSVVMRKKVDAAGGSYVREIVEFIDYVTAKGQKVALIPHSVRTGTDKTHNNDLPLCQEVYAKLAHKDKVLFVEQELGSQELRYIIGRCDLFVASRFHAMISSLAMGVPTLVIGWSHKYKEVLDMFGLSKWAFGQDKLTQEYLRTQFDTLDAEADEVQRKITTALPEVKKKAYRQVDVIVDVIEARGK